MNLSLVRSPVERYRSTETSSICSRSQTYEFLHTSLIRTRLIYFRICQRGNPMRVASQLIVGSTAKDEVTSVALDVVSSPKNIAIDELIKDRVNRRFHGQSVVSCLCLDSRSTSGLQLADLVAGSIAFDRRRVTQQGVTPLTPKAQVALELRVAFGLSDFSDQHSRRVNILTARASAPQHVVSQNQLST